MADTPRNDMMDHQCPLCGGPNQCAISAGAAAASCWCMSTLVSSQQRERAGELGYTANCLCPVCARPPQDPDLNSDRQNSGAVTQWQPNSRTEKL